MNTKPLVGVGVLLFDSDNKILLGKRINSHGEFCWGPPGGHLEFGESIEECAVREVLEEVGIKVANPWFLAIANDIFEKEDKHYVSIFMGAIFSKGQQLKHMEPNKVLGWEWYDINNLPYKLFPPLENFIKDKGLGRALQEAKEKLI